MSSPDQNESFRISRRFDVDEGHSKLVETIGDEEHSVERSVVVPSPKQKSPKPRLSLSERRSTAEKEAFETFQEETSGRKTPSPKTPDKHKLRRLSLAEETIRDEQEQAAELLRSAHKEINELVNESASPQRSPQRSRAESPDPNAAWLLKEDEEIYAKYGHLLDEVGGITDEAMNEAFRTAERILRTIDEVDEKIEDIDGAYLGLVQELVSFRLKCSYKTNLQLKHVANTMPPGYERTMIERKIWDKHTECTYKAEVLSLALYHKLKLQDPDMIRYLSVLQEGGPPQKEEKDFTTDEMLAFGKMKYFKLPFSPIKSPPGPVRVAPIITIRSPVKTPPKIPSPAKIATPPKSPRPDEQPQEPPLSVQRAKAKRKLSTEQDAPGKAKAKGKQLLTKGSKGSMSKQLPGKAGVSKQPVRQASKGALPKQAKARPPMKGGKKMSKSLMQRQEAIIEEAQKVSPPKPAVSPPRRDSMASPKAGPSGLQPGAYGETPKRPSPLRSTQAAAPIAPAEEPVLPAAAAAIGETPKTPKRSIRKQDSRYQDTIQRAQYILEEKNKLKAKYLEDVERAKSVIDNQVILANQLEFLKRQYNFDLETLVKQGRMHFMGTPVELAQSIDRMKERPRATPDEVRAVPRALVRRQSRTSLGPTMPSIPEIPPSRIPSRVPPGAFLTANNARELKAKAKREYDEAVLAAQDEPDPEQRAELMREAQEEFVRRKQNIDQIDDRKLELMKQYLRDKENLVRGEQNEMQRGVQEALLMELLQNELNDLNREAGIEEDYNDLNEDEIQMEVARRERAKIAMQEQMQKKREREKQAALAAREAERAKTAKASVAEKARESLARSMAARRKSLEAGTPQTPRVPPEIAARMAAAERVARAKEAAASASRASISRIPRKLSRQFDVPPGQPMDPAAERALAARQDAVEAVAKERAAIKAVLSRRRASVATADPRVLAAQRVALAKKAAMKESRESLFQVAKALRLPVKRPRAASLPAKMPARKASQKYVPGSETVRLRALAKQKYQQSIEETKRTIGDPEELAETLDFLKDEYKAQVGFISELDKEKLKEKKKYLDDLEAAKAINDKKAREMLMYVLYGNLVERLKMLDAAAGQPGREIGPIREEDIRKELEMLERQEKIAEREREKKRKAAAEAAEKAARAKQQAEMQAKAKEARMAAIQAKAAKASKSRKSLPGAQLLPAKGAPPAVPAKAASLPAKARYSKLKLKRRESMDPRLQAFLESQKQPAKPVMKTASQRYITTDPVKLRTQAKQQMLQEERRAKETIQNEQELNAALQEIRGRYKGRISRIGTIDKDKTDAKARYLERVNQVRSAVQDPAERQARLNELQEELKAELQNIDVQAGMQPQDIQLPPEKQIVQEVARRERLSLLDQEKRKKQKQDLAKAQELAMKIAKSRASLVPTRRGPGSVPPGRRKSVMGVPARRKSVLELARDPSLLRKVDVPRLVLQKKELDARTKKFLEEKRAMAPKKQLVRKASEKYIPGANILQQKAIQEDLIAKATEAYEAQKELARESAVDEEDLNEQLEFIEDEYKAKLHFIKNMENYKQSAQKQYARDVLTARKSIVDNDVLRERLEFLRDELKNKHAYIDEAAGLPRQPTFRSPTAEVKEQIGDIIHRMTTIRRKSLPAIKAAPLAEQEPAKGKRRASMAAAVRPVVKRRPSIAKRLFPEPAAEAPAAPAAPAAPGAAMPKRRAPSKTLMTEANRLAKQKFLMERRALSEQRPAKRPPMKKMVLKKGKLDPRVQQFLEESRPKSKIALPAQASRRYVPVAELNVYKGKAKTNMEKDIERAILNVQDEAKLANQVEQIKKKYKEQIAFIDGLPERRRRAEEKYMEERARVEQLYRDDPRTLEQHLELLKGEYQAKMVQLKEEVESGRPPTAAESVASVPGKASKIATMRALAEPFAPPKSERLPRKGKTGIAKRRASLAQLPAPPPPTTPPRAPTPPVSPRGPPGAPPSPPSPGSPKGGPSGPPGPPSPRTPKDRTPVPRKGTPATIPRMQVKKYGAPLRSLQKARLIEPKRSSFVLKKVERKGLRGISVEEALQKSIRAQTWKMPRSTCMTIKRKKMFERSLNALSGGGASNKQLLAAVVEGLDKIETPIPRDKLHPIAKRMGLDPGAQVEKVLDRATRQTDALEETLAAIPPTVAQSLQQRDHLAMSPLAAEEADGIFRMMMDEEEGIDLKGEPGDIVRLIVPSEGPTLAVAGNAIESPSKGVITDQVPVREINTLSDRNAEEFASTVKQQPPHKFPVESIAAKRLPEEPIEIPPPTEAKSKEDYIQHDLLLHSFEVENYFQARGTTFPKWFPGLYSVFPEESPKLVLKKSPSEVLMRAWQIMKPKMLSTKVR